MSISREVDSLERERDELKQLYGRARHDALVDGLTGLGNHRAFQDELARQLEVAKRMELPLALLLIDVDDLKVVNDTNGHASGDRLLEAVGWVVASVLRRSDRAFRVGGDEFAILLPVSDVETGLAVGRRILASALDGGDPSAAIDSFSVSIGVSAYPEPSRASHDLYRNADAALYWCKRHGRTAVVAYDPARHGAASDDRSVAELSEAVGEVLAKRALRPVFQPIFSMTTGRPVGFEGLVRPTSAAQFPDASALFGAAEAADRTVELDLACVETVAAGARLPDNDAYLSVNLSPRTLESSLFQVGDLKAIFSRHDIPLDRIVLELTEREQVEDLDQLQAERRRRVAGRACASRPTTSAPATPASGCSARSTSTSSRSTSRSSRAVSRRTRRTPCCGHSRSWRRSGRRRSSPRASRRHRSSRSSGASASPPGRATSSGDRCRR